MSSQWARTPAEMDLSWGLGHIAPPSAGQDVWTTDAIRERIVGHLDWRACLAVMCVDKAGFMSGVKRAWGRDHKADEPYLPVDAIVEALKAVKSRVSGHCPTGDWTVNRDWARTQGSRALS